MERRYLAATVAMAATFALFSHAFNAGLLTKLHHPRTTLISEAHCAAQTLKARLLDKVNRSLGSGSGEEAQLRLEFNLAAPALAAAPAAPLKQLKAPVAPPLVACRAPKLSAEVRLPINFSQMVHANVERAMRDQQLVVQTNLQSREFQRAMALQSRENQRAMAHAQREVARAGAAQARAAVYQARVNSPCPNKNKDAMRASSEREGQDVDWDQLSREIEQEVSRGMDINVRNF